MVVLLLGFTAMINPSSALKTSAVEIGEAKTVSSDAGATSREATPPSVTFEIGGAEQNEVVETGVDEVAYRSHIVKVSLNNVEEYLLFISGDANLKAPNGGTDLTGVGSNVTGGSIAVGRWGYGWDYTGSVTDAAMKYNTMPTAQTKLTVPALSNNAVSFNGKLNFAAKFPTNATLGNYTSSAVLTLIATPKANTGSATWRDAAGNVTAYEAGTGTMQGISEVSHGADGGFCRGNNKIGEGWTVDLQDNRGTNPVTYTIVKLNGNCWMAENLSLTGPMTLTTSDTDLAIGSDPWLLPASVTSWNATTSGSGQDNGNNVAQVRTGDSNLAGWMKGYGNYYSWCTATAGTCLENGTAIKDKDAASSICPKGWRLPPNSGVGSYQELTDAYKSDWQSGQIINGVSGMAGRRFGYNNPNTGSPYYWTNFWPAAGYVYNSHGSLDNVGSDGYDWSRTAGFDNSNAYSLDSYGSNVVPQRSVNRYNGYSVRCVADELAWQDDKGNAIMTSDVGTMQEVTKENFTDKYCANTTVANALVPVGSTLKLEDERDGNIYTIVKLKDGNCWMQQNLRLNLTGGTTVEGSRADGTAYNWNVPSNATTQASSANIWGASSSTPVVSRASTTENGNYYTWCAATAGTCSSTKSDGAVASASICPKGWKLPTGGGSDSTGTGEFGILLNGVGSPAVTQFPYNFPYAGLARFEGNTDGVGTSGEYWSSTASSDVAAYYLSFGNNGYFRPGTESHSRLVGFSVRCLAKPAS